MQEKLSKLKMEEHWKEFETRMVPKDASMSQRWDMKAAFWGGAFVTSQTYKLAADLTKSGRLDLAVQLIMDAEKAIDEMVEALAEYDSTSLN